MRGGDLGQGWGAWGTWHAKGAFMRLCLSKSDSVYSSGLLPEIPSFANFRGTDNLQ